MATNDTNVTEEIIEAPVEAQGEMSPEESREMFINEANKVEVPISVGMNALREDINRVIGNSPLHIECMLEVFRSTCTMLEKIASENAEKETQDYYSKINELKQKYGIAE